MGFCPLLEPVEATLDTPVPVLPVGLRPGKRLDQFESIAITALPIDPMSVAVVSHLQSYR